MVAGTDPGDDQSQMQPSGARRQRNTLAAPRNGSQLGLERIHFRTEWCDPSAVKCAEERLSGRLVDLGW